MYPVVEKGYEATKTESVFIYYSKGHYESKGDLETNLRHIWGKLTMRLPEHVNFEYLTGKLMLNVSKFLGVEALVKMISEKTTPQQKYYDDLNYADNKGYYLCICMHCLGLISGLQIYDTDENEERVTLIKLVPFKDTLDIMNERKLS
jgi:hypothetical protein